MFWLACEELKQETNPEAIEEKARYIYEDYISILSPKEVSSLHDYLECGQDFRSTSAEELQVPCSMIKESAVSE